MKCVLASIVFVAAFADASGQTFDAEITDSVTLYQAGRFEESVGASNRALRVLDRKAAIAHNNICSAKHRLGELDAAVEACTKALELLPEFERARNNLELAYRAMAERAPTADLYLHISLLSYRRQDYDACIDASRRAIELDANNAIAYNNICSAYTMKSEWDEAVTACTRSLEIDPSYERARANLEWVEANRSVAP